VLPFKFVLFCSLRAWEILPEASYDKR